MMNCHKKVFVGIVAAIMNEIVEQEEEEETLELMVQILLNYLSTEIIVNKLAIFSAFAQTQNFRSSNDLTIEQGR